MKYLVAYDGSTWSQEALKKAIELSAGLNTSITVLVVAEPLPIFSYTGIVDGTSQEWQDKSIPELQEQIKEHCRKRGQLLLEQAEKQLQASTIAHSLRLEVGSPRLVICEVAEQEKSDIIFIGSRGLGSLSRLILGSVSDFVVHHAPCSVFVVHLAEQPST